MIDFFPTGYLHYLLGGILIGLSVAGLYIFTGYIAGASASIDGFLSYISKKIDSTFSDKRIALFVGIVIGGLLFAVTQNGFIQTQVQWWRLLIGGFFVGIGAGFARGCTSGHGIAGLGSLAKSSFVYVALFMVIAIITAFVMSSIGVMP